MFVVPFVFIYLSCGEAFYVYLSEDKYYCAKVFNKWIAGSTIESVTNEIDKYNYELIRLYDEHQGR